MIYGFYGYQFPGGDMAERFGSNSTIGSGFMVKSSSGWIAGAEYGYIFGPNVKYGFDLLENLMTSGGNIINGDGVPAVVALFERGHAVTARFGKLFPVLKDDPNSGIFFTVGIGYLTHKIRIDVENLNAPQLKDDYRRGYDRLSGGLLLSQSIGFMYFGQRKLLNFHVALEIQEAFTKNMRDYNFDTMTYTTGNRFDLLIGPKISWMIPFRKRMAREFYYY